MTRIINNEDLLKASKELKTMADKLNKFRHANLDRKNFEISYYHEKVFSDVNQQLLDTEEYCERASSWLLGEYYKTKEGMRGKCVKKTCRKTRK